MSGREEATSLLREHAEAGRGVRIAGGRTKLGWGRPVELDRQLSTASLDRIVEHNEGDLTAVLEAGVPLARAQARFADAGQMLALDPPLGDGDRATVGGVIATGDSGPLRQRYGGARDLVVGTTAALSDGSLVKSGGKVIKNVAGYDLSKLFAGSFGTLGLIVEVAVRLHPRPQETVTVTGASDDPDALARGAQALSHARLEKLALDVAWGEGSGRVLARFAGPAAEADARVARALLDGIEVAVTDDDGALWDRQRAGQRSAAATVVRVSGRQTQLADVLRAAERAAASVVGRAGLGLSWITLPVEAGPGAVERLRHDLAPSPCVVFDAPAELRAALDPWGADADPLMRRVKQRFDPGGACNPGVFLSGL